MRYRLKGKPLYRKSGRDAVRGSYYIRREHDLKLRRIAQKVRCSVSNAIEVLVDRYGDDLMSSGLRRDETTGALVAAHD